MKKSQKIAEAVNASMYHYPYENLSLVDMEGEIWKPMLNYEDYYMVSNKGRIKSLPREMKRDQFGGRFFTYTLQERIKKQVIFKYFSVCYNKYTYNLEGRTSVNGKSTGYNVSRAVYETFVGPVPDGMLILHKNGDSFDNSPENLYLVSRKEVLRDRYEKNREIFNKRQNRISEKVVSQYDVKGNYINTYRSLSDAARAMGVGTSNIKNAIRGKNMLCKGYCWRRGDSKVKLDTSFLEERKRQARQRVIESHYKKVVQYDHSTGKIVAVYNSIKKAVEQTGIYVHSMRPVLRGKRYQTHGFIWRYASSFDEIPERIEVDEHK